MDTLYDMRSKYDRAVELSLKYVNGRKIVLYGIDVSIKDSLKRYGLIADKIVSDNPASFSNEIRPISEIKNQNEEYYIIVPYLEHTNDSVAFLNSLGYQETNDFMYVNADYYLRKSGKGKTYYIIRFLEPLQGLGAMLNSTIGHMRYAIEKNYIPVVDWKNYPNDLLDLDNLGKENAWEFFFEQPFGTKLEDAYNGDNVIVSSGINDKPRPHESMGYFSDIGGELSGWRRFIQETGCFKIKSNILNHIKTIFNKNFSADDRVLGVSLRGTDYVARHYYMHPAQPPISVVIIKIDEVIKYYNCNKIFLVTEDEKLLKILKDKYGSMCISINKPYRKYVNEGHAGLHKFSLGIEKEHYNSAMVYLTEMVMLSLCKQIICGRCGGSVAFNVLTKGFDYSFAFDFGRYGVPERNNCEVLPERIEDPVICYDTHTPRFEWSYPACNGEICGDIYGNEPIDLIKIYFWYPYYKVKYAVYSVKAGWIYGNAGMEIGDSNFGLPLSGIKVYLDEKDEKNKFDIFYRLHNLNGDWTCWAKNGEELYSNGAFNGVQIMYRNLSNVIIKKIKDYMCIGCEACVNVCPQKAVRLKADSYGHCRPALSILQCTDCGRCSEVCPSYQIPNAVTEYNNRLKIIDGAWNYFYKMFAIEMPWKQIRDTLCHVNNIVTYLDMLLILVRKLTVIMVVRDTPGNAMEDAVIRRIHALGFTNFTNELWRMYVGVCDAGQVICNTSGKMQETSVVLHLQAPGNTDDFVLESKAWRQGNVAKIIINGMDYSTNLRGINLVVYDREKREVWDSIGFDSHDYAAGFVRRDKF